MIIFRMIVKKLLGIVAKKREIFGIFRRGGLSHDCFWKLFKEEIKIRIDNHQNFINIIYNFF